jgi:hypothetical protein
MRSANATRWSREAILAIGNIIAFDNETEGEGETGGAGEANSNGSESEAGKNSAKDDDGDDDPAVLKRKLQNRAEQASRQDAEIARLKKVEQEADELRKAKEELDRKGRSELENLKADLEKRDKTIAAKDDTIRRLTVENAFMTLKEIDWHNPATALRLVDLSDVEFDESTGQVKDRKALVNAAKELAKENPYLVKSKTAVDEGTPNGKQSGKVPAGGKPKETDDAALRNKYNIHI